MKWPFAKIESIRAPVRNSLVGGPFGSDLTTRDYVEDGVPVIRGVNLPDELPFRDDDFVFVRQEKADALSSNNAHPGDLIFTQRGTLGQVGIIPANSRFPRYLVSQSQMKLTVDPTKAHTQFVFYYFRHPNTVQSIKSRAITSGVPHINLGILREFELPLPPLHTQESIVNVLSSYDDLLANNRRRMALLEESARLLYREWFVRLRFPGHECTKIVDGIPAGWSRTELGDVLTLKRGHDLPEQNRLEGEIPVVSSSGITGWHNAKKADPPGIVTGRYGTLGEVYYIDTEYWPLNTALYVSDFKAAEPLFAFYLLQATLNTIQSDKAAVPGVNRNVLHAMPVLLPPASLRIEFVTVVNPVREMFSKLMIQNEKLRGARDMLLPRLMSGEVIV